MAWFSGGVYDEGFTIMHDSAGVRVVGRGRNISCDSRMEAETVIAELLAASSTGVPCFPGASQP
jgi:hypothetical protein